MGRSTIVVMQIGTVWCRAGGKSEAAVIATASVTNELGGFRDGGGEFELVSSKEGVY